MCYSSSCILVDNLHVQQEAVDVSCQYNSNLITHWLAICSTSVRETSAEARAKIYEIQKLKKEQEKEKKIFLFHIISKAVKREEEKAM